MADTPEIADWTQNPTFTGSLTRKNNLTAVVRVCAFISPIQEADKTPEPNELAQWGLFRLNAMDDGQPDPTHVGQLLMSLMERPGRHSSIFAYWGEAAVGCINRPPRGTAVPPIPMLYFLPPPFARLVLGSMKEGS